MARTPSTSGTATPGCESRLAEVNRIDQAVYAAVAATPTPRLDGVMRRLSTAANYLRLSVASSAVLALAGGRRGRRAAMSGLAAAVATTTIVNLVAKPFGQRRRPNRLADEVPLARQVPMPHSRSFPSGHAASAVAFASGAGHLMPAMSAPLHVLSALVAYSRVHTGVHFPGDAIAGAILGAAIADITTDVLDRRWTQA